MWRRTVSWTSRALLKQGAADRTARMAAACLVERVLVPCASGIRPLVP